MRGLHAVTPAGQARKYLPPPLVPTRKQSRTSKIKPIIKCTNLCRSGSTLHARCAKKQIQAASESKSDSYPRAQLGLQYWFNSPHASVPHAVLSNYVGRLSILHSRLSTLVRKSFEVSQNALQNFSSHTHSTVSMRECVWLYVCVCVRVCGCVCVCLCVPTSISII